MLYHLLFRYVLTRTDPEWIHHLTVRALGAVHSLPGAPALFRALFGSPDRSLETGAIGLRMRTPFGIAAGFDKAGEVPLALLDMSFGHVEIGTVTAHAQPGNQRPRSFRLVGDRALVNRMGFNNPGAAEVARRLREVRATRAGAAAVIGVNIGKSRRTPVTEAVEDYRTSARLLAPYASYLAVNVSSPNTPHLRDLQAVDSLRPVLEAVLAEADTPGRTVPVLVKIAPDLADEDVRAVARLARDLGLAGVIATNTTIARPRELRTPRDKVLALGAGGLSGPILAERALEVLDLLVDEGGPDLAIVSAGGIVTARDVHERLEHGAAFTQGFTGLIYEGPFWGRSLNRALARRRADAVS